MTGASIDPAQHQPRGRVLRLECRAGGRLCAGGGRARARTRGPPHRPRVRRTMKGLMGVLADAILDAGGSAHGVITRRLLDRGRLHQRLTGHEVAAAMGVRKARMLALADACIALPGGIGTVEEMMEAWTLNQLGDVDKPV